MNGIEQDVLQAKVDSNAMTDLVERERGWILRTAGEVTNRYITESDDEWSIALMAFDEAVRQFEGGKGSFRGLAALVIRRRLLDYLRAEGRHADETAVTPEAFDGALDEESAQGIELQTQQAAAEAAGAQSASSAAREEIEAVGAVLRRYGFSFFDLADCSPRTDKTKRACALAVRTMLRIAELLALMRRKLALPMKELSQESGVARKLLDRHRRYIIAATEILDGDFPILAGYMDYIRKG